MRTLVARSVGIEPQETGGREKILQLVLEKLCSDPAPADICAPAFRTLRRGTFGRPTIVATKQGTHAMIGERYRAPAATNHVTACLALYVVGESSTVQEDNHLFFSSQSLGDRITQRPRQGGGRPLSRLLPHVNDADVRQRPTANTFRENGKAVATSLCVSVALKRRSCAPENESGICQAAAFKCYIARMISRIIIALLV
jgi:hypothetical protein